jgi:hypothetical protein
MASFITIVAAILVAAQIWRDPSILTSFLFWFGGTLVVIFGWGWIYYHLQHGF